MREEGLLAALPVQQSREVSVHHRIIGVIE
jgi:hypothetical protein